jgi:hypothetical protein
MEYEAVPHSHVVPAGYLRPWAAGRRIAMRRVGEQRSALIGVRDAGVRKDFYRRTRPTTGENIYDVEWSLRQGENAALPIIARLPERWPLELEDKGKLGQLFAAQHVRGPAFKAWHERFLQQQFDTLRADPAQHATPPPGMTAEEAVERTIDLWSSDTNRALRMLSLVRPVGIAFTSMHWILVEFDKPRLATSDQPIVIWPLRRSRSRPQPNDLNDGVCETLEVFVPIGPTHLLLMTWVDDENAREVVRGLGRHIATANAFVAASADQQWFHKPDVTPPLAKGPREPLSAELVAAYDADVARRSSRRRQAAALANARIREPLSNEPISVVP